MTGPSGNGSLSVTSVNTSSMMRPPLTSIEALLERLRADPAEGVEETFAVLAQVRVGADHVLDRIHDAFGIETWPQNFAQRGIFRPRAAEQNLIILHTFAVDSQYA